MTVALAQPKADTYPPLVLSPSMFHPPPYYVPFNNYKEDHSNFSYLLEGITYICHECHEEWVELPLKIFGTLLKLIKLEFKIFP